MSVLKKYTFHFRETYSSGNFKNYFLEASSFDVEKAKEIALMGIRRKCDLEFIKDLSDYSIDDFTDYMIIHDRVGPIIPKEDPYYMMAKRNVKIKELFEDEPNN